MEKKFGYNRNINNVRAKEGVTTGSSKSYVHVVKVKNIFGALECDSMPSIVLDDECLISKDLSKALLGRVKEFASLPNLKIVLKNEGFAEIKIQYMGEFWVLLEFPSSKTKELFQENIWVGSWFSVLKQASSDFIPEGRYVWVEIEGVSFKLWSKNTFKRIAAKWGELLDVDDQEEEGFHSKSFGDDSNEVEVPETVFEESLEQKENQSKDPFGIYLLLNKNKDKSKNMKPSDHSLKYPPGFIPNGDNNEFCANVFNAFIAKVGLEEVPLGGISFTWCHKSAIKMSKLDRPISLIGSMYKIIAKILANHLVGVLGDIVNEVQSAFITERQILDGPFILNEAQKYEETCLGCKLRRRLSISNKASWVKWKSVLASKEKGGLGVGKVSKAGSRSCWRNIVNEVRILSNQGIKVLDYMWIKLGNEESTAFWDDNWIGGKVLKYSFPRIYALETEKEVIVNSKMSDTMLENSLRRGIRGGVEQVQFNELSDMLQSVSLMPYSDRWVWSLEGSGEFSVASIRKIIDDNHLSIVDTRNLWIKYVPIKVNVLAWKIKIKALPTMFNISRRGIDVDSILCPINHWKYKENNMVRNNKWKVKGRVVEEIRSTVNKFFVLKTLPKDNDQEIRILNGRMIIDKFLNEKIQPTLKESVTWTRDMINYFKNRWDDYVPMEDNSRNGGNDIEDVLEDNSGTTKVMADDVIDGNLFKRVESLRGQLQKTQVDIDKDPNNHNLKETKSLLIKEFHEAERDEEKFLFQQAKIKWLCEGDKNSSFFHKVQKGRSNKKFLGKAQHVQDIEEVSTLFQRRINEAVAFKMTSGVTDKEIKEAMFDIGDSKALGPDGFSAAFFKKAWSIIGLDICNAIRKKLHLGSCLLCHRDCDSVNVIKKELDEFSKCFRLLPNNSKSIVFFGGLCIEDKQAILNVLLFAISTLPVRYLGVPLISKRLSVKEFIIINEINKMLKGFLRNQGDSAKGKAKIAWKNICRPKAQSGLGLKNLQVWNQALLAKHIWNIASKKDNLWFKWVHSVKLRSKSIWEVSVDSNDSWGWKNLLTIRDLIMNNVRCIVRNGNGTSMWFDNWSSMGYLFKILSHEDLYEARLKDELTVGDMISNCQWLWPEDWYEKFPLITRIVSPTLNEDKFDKIVWKNRDGKEMKFSLSKTDLLPKTSLGNGGIMQLTDVVYVFQLKDVIRTSEDVFKSIMEEIGHKLLGLTVKDSKAVRDVDEKWKEDSVLKELFGSTKYIIIGGNDSSTLKVSVPGIVMPYPMRLLIQAMRMQLFLGVTFLMIRKCSYFGRALHSVNGMADPFLMMPDLPLYKSLWWQDE
nr:RNA-directed DNA polymerase, eukaryota, reverse transcriptase zinc-binding domain protein [Tanacetum cinerariifolium]